MYWNVILIFPLVHLGHLWGVHYIVKIKALLARLKEYLSCRWIFCYWDILYICMSKDATLVFLLWRRGAFLTVLLLYVFKNKRVWAWWIYGCILFMSLYCLNQNSIFFPVCGQPRTLVLHVVMVYYSVLYW